MKSHLLKAMLAFVVLFMTINANAQYRYLDADFSSEIPTGWTTETTHSVDNWEVDDESLQFVGESLNSFAVLISPEVNLKEAVEPIVQFRYRNEQFDGMLNKFEAYYRVAPDSVWVLLLSSEEREKHFKDFKFTIADSLKTEHFQLKFEVTNRFGAVTAIDDVLIVEDNVCINAPTNLDLTDVSESMAMLAWNTDSVAVNTRIVLATKLFKSEKDIIADAVVFDSTFAANKLINTVKIENLVGGTTYYAYVQADCQYGDLSPWTMDSLVTPCTAISTPFTDDFEKGLGCWQIKTSGSYAPKFVSNKYSSDTTSVYFYTAKNNFVYAYTPEFDVEDIRKMALKLDVYSDKVGSSSYTSEIVVGVLTNPADESTFAPVHVIAPTEKSTWQTIEVTFRDYTGDAYGNFGKYIAFRGGNASKANYIWIDNVELDIAGCSAPQMVTLGEVTAHTATLSWTEMGSSTKWNIKVSDTELDSAALAAITQFDLVADTTVVTITGLQPNAKYYVYIQSECGTWADVVEVETKRVWQVGYIDNLNYKTLPTDWKAGYVTQSTGAYGTSSSYIPKINTSATYNNSSLLTSAVGALYFNHTTSYNPFCIFPEIDVERIQDIQFTFYARMATLTEGMVVSVCTSQDIATATPIDTIYPSEKNKYEHYVVTFERYQGTGKYIALSAKLTEKATAANGTYFDDFAIDSLSHCNTPGSIKAKSIGTDCVTLSWTPNASYKWNLQLFTEKKTDASVAVIDTIVETPSCVVIGLDHSTTYYAYAAAIEGENMSSYTPACQFNTVYVMTVPYYNNFTGESKSPKGWVVFNEKSKSSSYIPSIYTSNWTFARSYKAPSDLTKPSLKFATANNRNTTAYRAYAVMPALADTLDINSLYVSFYLHATTSTADLRNIEVGVMSDPNDPSTFQLVDVMHVETASVPQMCYVSLAGYKGDGRMIAFRTEDEKAVTLYIDNLTIEQIAECAKVTNVETAELTDSSAVITWLNGNKETEWNVKVFDYKVTSTDLAEKEGNVLNTTTTEKPLKIANLDYNTKYWIAVQAKTVNCVGDWSNVYEFKTNCPAKYALPYLETFNDMPKEVLLDCFLAKGDNAGHTPKTYASSKYSYPDYETKDDETGGDKGIILKFYAGAEYYSYLIFPEFEKPINELQMSFYAFGYDKSYPAYIEIGVMEDIDSTFLDAIEYTNVAPTTDSLFVPIARFDCQSKGMDVWEYCMVQFDSYAGKGKHIALRAGGHKERLGTGYENKIYLDHIKVETLPTCTQIIDAAITEIGTDKATLSWSARTEKNWNLKVATSKLNPNEDKGWLLNTEITSCPYTITGLQPNTRYYAYVQRVNKEEDCIGDWSAVVAFNTECAPTTTSFFDSFESNREQYGSGVAPRCWNIVGTSPTKSYVNMLNVGGTMGKKPTKGDSLVFVLYNGSKFDYTNDVNVVYTSYAVLPELALDSVEQVQLRFLAHTRGEDYGAFEVGVMTDPEDPSTYRAVFADTVPANDEWNEYIVNFLNYTCDDYGDIGKHLVLRPMPGLDRDKPERTTSNTIYIDSVYVEEYQVCVKPISFGVETVGEDFIGLKWRGNGDRYRVLVGRSGNFDEKSAVVDTIVTNSNPIINGLPMSSYLGAKVQMLCDEDGSAWSDVVMFRTLGCNNQLPYIEGFEGLASSNYVPDCWNAYNANSALGYGEGGDLGYVTVGHGPTETFASAHVTTSNPSEGTKSLGVGTKSSYNGYAILPKLAIDDYSQVAMSFSAYSYSNNNKIEVGVIEDATDINTYQGLETYGVSSRQPRVEVVINFADYADVITPRHRIVFRGFGDTGEGSQMYIDDIVVNYSDKGLWAPFNIEVSDITYNSVTLDWRKLGVADEFEVAVVLADSALTDETLRLKTTDTRIVLTDLMSTTKYDVYIRTRQGNDYSEWTNPYTFYTYSESTELPYFTSFNDSADNAKWTLLQTNLKDVPCVNQWTFGSAVSYGTSDNMSLYISNDSSSWAYTHVLASNHNSFCWAYRMFKVERAGYYDIELMARNEARQGDSYDYLSVAFMPASYVPKKGGNTCTDVYTNALLSHSSSNVIAKTFDKADWTNVKSKVYVDAPGYYTLFCYWNNYAVSAYDYKPAAIDSLSIKEATCGPATDLVVDQLFDTTAVIAWKGMESLTWNVIVSKSEVEDPTTLPADFIFLDTTVNTLSVELPLEVSTSYYVYVRSTCDSTMAWEKVLVETMCNAQAVPYRNDFGEKTYTSVDCWETSSGTNLQAVDWADEVCISFSNSKALILPLFDASLKDLQLTFRASHDGSSVMGTVPPTDFEVGVLTNPLDMATYEKVMMVRTPGTYRQESDAEWGEFYCNFANYTGSGRYIVFKTSQGTFYIDDVVIELTPECAQPFNLTAGAVSSNSAVVRWNYREDQDRWVVKAVAQAVDRITLDTLSNVLFVDTLTTAQVTVNNLRPASKNYVYVKSLCADAGHWSLPLVIETAPAPLPMPYNETFTDIKQEQLPIAWLRYDNVKYSDFLKGEAEIKYIESYKTDYIYLAVQEKEEFSNSPVLYSSLNAYDKDSYAYRWAIGPEIEIDQPAVLAFDVIIKKAFRYNFNGKAVTENRESHVRVLVSDDNGQTWPIEQSILIGDAKNADYQINQFMDKWGRVYIDLTQYVGKNIRFAFYVESVDRAELYCYFDNIKVRCSDTYNYTETAFEKRDYEGYGFEIDYSELTPGLKSYTRLAENADVDGCDSIVNLTLDVQPILRNNISAIMCPGDEVYVENGFSVSEPGVYRQRHVVASGADSVVTLTLGLYDGETEFAIDTTITEGESYEFGGELLTESGVYRDSLVNQYGCDSVVVLTLTVEKTPITGLDNAELVELVLTPNPVAVGEELLINATFTADQLAGMVVEVFNATGQCVYVSHPAVTPIAITGLPQAGVYMVNITTAGGSRYQGKVIVR